MANTNFNSRGQHPKHGVSQWQKPYPPETKAIKEAPPQTKENQTKRQTQSKTPTPPEVENTRFYQLFLDKPQDKHRSIKQQCKSKHIWPRHKSHKHKPHVTHKQGRLIGHVPQQEKCGPP
jgi:hypothetical protein